MPHPPLCVIAQDGLQQSPVHPAICKERLRQKWLPSSLKRFRKLIGRLTADLSEAKQVDLSICDEHRAEQMRLADMRRKP